jgi:hypothetical protein
MNWTRFQTHGMADDKAFEVLSNQLFENCIKEESSANLAEFSVVNGAGGDGGVESYAVLKNGSVIGLQAKWFPSSITSSQIAQIRGSIRTALKVRPQIARYIVCVPRDLASKTARTNNAENSRWETLVREMAEEYPNVIIELWNEMRLMTELQKPACAGIYRFWFENAEISETTIGNAFEKAKSGWLNTKYVPELNTYGRIEKTLNAFLGECEQRLTAKRELSRISDLCEKYKKSVDALISLGIDEDNELKKELLDADAHLDAVRNYCEKIENWLKNESEFEDEIESNLFNMNFEYLIEKMRQSKATYQYHFHYTEVTKVLRKLSEINGKKLIREIEAGRNKKSILFLGNPGTGKTHGVSAVSEKLLHEGLHIPLVIRARDIPITASWKDIISNYLGLSAAWSEEELWQGLTSMVNRHRFTEAYCAGEVHILPKLIVFIDGLDESYPHDKWIERIRETEAIVSRYPQIRFCFTSRPTAMPSSINCAVEIHLGSSGDVPAYKLFDAYISAYNISVRNAGLLKSTLKTPLALKLFCELNKNRTVVCSDRSDVTMSDLWRQKIEVIEKEYAIEISDSSKDQYVFRAIVYLSSAVLTNSSFERNQLLKDLESNLSISIIKAERLLNCLENYGVLSCCREPGTGILPDIYRYYPGVQGYFDYASAMILLEKYEHPQKIDFNHCQRIQSDTLNALAILSMQKFDYLLTKNKTIADLTEDWEWQELQYFALQHTNHNNAVQFVPRSKEIMAYNAECLMTVVNKLVLPLARDYGHPLGVSLLDDFLWKFDKPAQRDIFWSIPGFFQDGQNKKWNQNQDFELIDEEYILNEDDLYEGLPTVYAWALSSVSNSLRKSFRERLLIWARILPEEFYKLFIKFSGVNDPQIKADLFSILMCVVYDVNTPEIVKTASCWVMENILHPERIDCNRDIAIRYYSIAIVNKAVMDGIVSKAEADLFLPPYHAQNNDVLLSLEALEGDRMGGYKGITYDLARYVLIDHFEYAFSSYKHGAKDQFKRLIHDIAVEQPDYNNIELEQFILSMAYAFVRQMGWNEEEFHSFVKDGTDVGSVGGVDVSIQKRHWPADHGSLSPFMTVCEKYVWQARNTISGFLCDRLMFGDEEIEIVDYSMLDDFVIPSHEEIEFDPSNIPEDNPWNIPEPEVVMLDGKNKSRDELIARALNAPTINWEKWIFTGNPNNKYHVNGDSLVALSMYSCFYGEADIETVLLINAVLLESKDVATFVAALEEAGKQQNDLTNPYEWYGGVDTSCYITPKEVCWFPWKTRHDTSNADEFPQLNIISAVDYCSYNSPEYGDIHFDIPSAPIRELLEIVDSEGFQYKQFDDRVVAEYTMAGDRWRTYQTYLFADRKSLLNQLVQNKLALVWIMRERRSHSGKALEKYGRFGLDRFKSYAGYFEGDLFIIKEIHSEVKKYIPYSRK